MQKNYALGRYSMVFQSGIFAIVKAAEQIPERDASRSLVSICLDSQAPLKAIRSTRTSTVIVQECTDALDSGFRTRSCPIVGTGTQRDQRQRAGKVPTCPAVDPTQ